MYCGHARLCVSVCVCVCVCQSVSLSAAACPHYCTDPDVTWGSGRGCPPSCALLGGFAIGAPVVLLWKHNANPSYYKLASTPLYDDIVRTRNVSECSVLALCLVYLFKHKRQRVYATYQSPSHKQNPLKSAKHFTKRLKGLKCTPYCQRLAIESRNLSFGVEFCSKMLSSYGNFCVQCYYLSPCTMRSSQRSVARPIAATIASCKQNVTQVTSKNSVNHNAFVVAYFISLRRDLSISINTIILTDVNSSHVFSTARGV